MKTYLDVRRDVAAICPIFDFRADNINDKSTWVITFLPEATTAQQNAAMDLLNAYDVGGLVVPASVTPRQARLALLQAGLLDQVTAAVNSDGGATLITWEYASVFLRTDPLITSIGASLNMTSEQIDQLFIAAAAL